MTTMRTGMLGRTLYYVLTGGLAIIFLFPLLWSLAASVSPQASTGQVNGFGLGNYMTLFNYGAGLVQFLLNSAYVALLTVAITLAVSTLGGYAFARFRFPGREVLFLLTLSILMVVRDAAHPAICAPQWPWAAEFPDWPQLGTGDVPAPVCHVHDAYLVRSGAA